MDGVEGFVRGTVIGAVQTVVGHPLDTWKVRLQHGGGRPRAGWFAGVRYPLYASMVFGGLQFGLFDQATAHWSPGWAGMAVGLVTSPVVCFYDLHKVRCQTAGAPVPWRDVWGVRPTGLGVCALRETLATGLYFGVYRYGVDEAGWHPFAAGVASGFQCGEQAAGEFCSVAGSFLITGHHGVDHMRAAQHVAECHAVLTHFFPGPGVVLGAGAYSHLTVAAQNGELALLYIYV